MGKEFAPGDFSWRYVVGSYQFAACSWQFSVMFAGSSSYMLKIMLYKKEKFAACFTSKLQT